jgi:uncharacterized protein (TIGR01370 family)
LKKLLGLFVSATVSLASQASLACPEVGRDRAERVASAFSSGYGVQYWGPLFQADTLAQAPHGLLIIEATKIGAPDTADGREVTFTPEEMNQMRHQGARPVLAYLNLTEVEPWRDYWPEDGQTPPWLGPETPSGDKLAAFWRPEWRDLLRKRVIRLMNTGADGLFLDDALNYFVAGSMNLNASEAPSDIPQAAEVMLSLVQEIAAQARTVRCDALIIVNNGVFVGRDAGPTNLGAFNTYRSTIDGIMIEDGLGAADTPALHTALREDYLARGIPVLSLDFASGAQTERVVHRARAKGYVPYVVPDGSFSSLQLPVKQVP